MTNPQLIDYIRKQFSENIARETIKSNLMSQGWTEQDVSEGFGVIDHPVTASTSLWTTRIPRTNKVFMIISLLLVFGLDLLLVISSPSLAPYWYMMLGVLAVFAIFYCLENFVFQKRFANTTSNLDIWISPIIVLRNIVFLLNFVPLIQMIGLGLLGGLISLMPAMLGGNGLGLGFFGFFGWAAPVILVVYIILIASRYLTTKSA